MVTTEEQITYLAQQLNAMQTDVAEVQNALQGSTTRYADLIVQLFTSETRARMVIGAGEEATAVMSGLQALETRSTGAMTSVAQRFRGKATTEYKPQTWSGEKGSESFTGVKMELQSWVRSPHDNMMTVMDVAEAKEGRLMELDIRNAGMSQETVDRRLSQVLISCTKREANNCVCKPERSGFKAWKQMVSHFNPRTGADESVAYARVTHPVSQSGLTSSDAAECQKHVADTGTSGGRI